MTAQHSPGPWRIEHGGIYGAPEGRARQPDYCKLIAPIPQGAQVQRWGSYDATQAEYDANARLLAAAPDLLAALTECLAGLRALRKSYPDIQFPDTAFYGAINAQVAIAQATGETTP